MTIREAINLARQLKQISPTNYPDALMLQFINECEGKIQTEFLRISEIDCQRYTEDDLDKTLIVSPPHDKLYYTYLCAMIDFTNGEYNKYQNAIVIANSFMAEWAAWFNRTHRRDGREYQGVFLSAYGIAVKWGYKGTEEEWLASLEGPQGPPGASLVSVEQTVESTEDGGRNEIVLRYGEGEEDYATIFVRNGRTGPAGEDGPPGPAGVDGKSPTISVEEKVISGASSIIYKAVTITNPDGSTETFNLYNGQRGPAGAPGKFYCPVIDDDGNLSWRVYNGNDLVPMPPTVNIKGPKGDPGDGSGGGVSKASELDNDVPFVSADEQSLTEEQKAQARENIGVSWDNLEGKPFGEVEAVIIEEQIVAFESGQGSATAKNIPPVGSTVVVEWDGEKYECIVSDFNGASFFGNGAIVGLEDTGEPFAIMVVYTEMVFVVSVDAEKANAIVKVVGSSVNKLDIKFYAGVVTFYGMYDTNVDEYLYVDPALTTKATISDIAMANKNFLIRICSNGVYYSTAVDVELSGEFAMVRILQVEDDGITDKKYYALE